jgi:hypothetical protein
MESSIFWDVTLCSLLNDVSEEHVTIFDKPSKDGKLASCSSAPKIEATFSSKTSLYFQWVTSKKSELFIIHLHQQKSKQIFIQETLHFCDLLLAIKFVVHAWATVQYHNTEMY